MGRAWRDWECECGRGAPAGYREGEGRVAGTVRGGSVGGRGFVELVGYDPSQLDPTPVP